MDAETKQTPPAYFAFKTLTNMIVKMEEHGPPNRVDRTFLHGMSGAGQTQLIAGLKSLGLIDNDGTVQPVLAELVSRPNERPALIGKLLREKYPEAVELGKTNATTGELVEIFNQYGVQGDTARKAIAFYLNAARYAGDIRLSPNFKTPTVRTGTGSSKKRRPAQQPPADENGNASGAGTPSGLHPALSGLLGDIPKRGQTWSQREHDDFMAAFKAVIKIAAPISDEMVNVDDLIEDDE